MPYIKKVNDIALGKSNSFFNKIKGEITALILANKMVFYELELFNVTNVLLEESELPNKNYKYYGAIQGYWVNDDTKKTLPKGEVWVLPLDKKKKKYPLPGENVVCVNYLGRTYYSTILNHQNNPNNNILSGLSGNAPKGEAPPEASTLPMFNKPLKANMGDIVIQGRFNNSINIGSQDMVGSSIKLVAHGADDRENPTYDLEKDAASIYIQDGGNVKVKNPNSKLGSNIVTGKKIVLDADYIVINAKKQLKLQGGELVEVVGGNTEIKHNKGGKIVTGETEKAIDELRERTKTKLVDTFEKTKDEFIQAKNKGQEAFNKGIQDLRELDDKMKDAVENIEKNIKKIRQVSFTFDAQEFTKVQDKVNKLQKDLAETPDLLPNGAPNPKKFKLVADLITVFRSFATLDFMNKDIVTIKKKK